MLIKINTLFYLRQLTNKTCWWRSIGTSPQHHLPTRKDVLYTQGKNVIRDPLLRDIQVPYGNFRLAIVKRLAITSRVVTARKTEWHATAWGKPSRKRSNDRCVNCCIQFWKRRREDGIDSPDSGFLMHMQLETTRPSFGISNWRVWRNGRTVQHDGWASEMPGLTSFVTLDISKSAYEIEHVRWSEWTDELGTRAHRFFLLSHFFTLLSTLFHFVQPTAVFFRKKRGNPLVLNNTRWTADGSTKRTPSSQLLLCTHSG